MRFGYEYGYIEIIKKYVADRFKNAVFGLKMPGFNEGYALLLPREWEEVRRP